MPAIEAIPGLTLSRQMTGIQNSYFVPSSSFPSAQASNTLRAVSLCAILAIMIQTTNNGMSQGVGIQLKTLQTLLSLTADFPIIHGRLLENVRAFIPLRFLADGDAQKGLFQGPRRRRHGANWS